LAPIDAELMLKIAERAVRRNMVAKAGAAGGDGVGKDAADCGAQGLGALALHGSRFAFRRYGGPEQALAHIDITEPGDDTLIHERRLDRARTALETARQFAGVELVGQGVGPQLGKQFVVIDGIGVIQQHGAKSARIGKADYRAGVGHKIDVIVAAGGWRVLGPHGHMAAHAQMNNHDAAIAHMDQQIFGPPGEPLDAVADQPFGQIGRQRPTEFGDAHLDRGQGGVFQCRRQATAHGFDFGQFGHGNKVAVLEVFGYGPAMSEDTNQVTGAVPPPTPPPGSASKVNFGRQSVSPEEKTRLVRDVFDSVAGRYDLMNDLMSAGVHRAWKAELVRRLRPTRDDRIIDVGGGTGDIAFRMMNAGAGDVRICDINLEMLETGRGRAADKGMAAGPGWICGNAEALPFADSSADVYVTAFCLRNVTQLGAALSEARRVLRPGGRFFCLEFSHVAIPALAALYDRYSFNVLPWLGQIVAQDRGSYLYLAESIRRFPDQESFADMIGRAGLHAPKFQNLSAGIAAIHWARRI
jgi:demethylmenaquinone methyltransferase/2-methoxy-6-polyprenyl-1,4-benzoquinol methylase